MKSHTASAGVTKNNTTQRTARNRPMTPEERMATPSIDFTGTDKMNSEDCFSKDKK